MPVGEDNLRNIADATGGAFFTASTLEELEAVYDDIGSAIGYEDVNQEITDWFVGSGWRCWPSTAVEPALVPAPALRRGQARPDLRPTARSAAAADRSRSMTGSPAAPSTFSLTTFDEPPGFIVTP